MEFCQRGEYEVFFGGAKGPGKTDCLIADAARDVGHPKYHGVIIRKTFPRLQEIIDRTWAIYPKIGGQYRANKSRWEWPNGSRITLGHCQHEEDKRNYHGKEFHYVGFDELTEFSETQYLFILANIRKSDAGLPILIRSTSNPGGPGHVWVKKRFVDTCTPTEKFNYPGGDGEIHEMFNPKVFIDPITGTSRCFVPATVYDNPSIMVNDPGYVRRLEALPELERLRLLHGVWDVFEGQVFPELSQRTHGCDPFEIPVDWERFMAFDWGYSHPYACLWFAVDFDGVLYLYKELYGSKFEKSGDPNDYDKGLRETNSQICQAIHDAEREERAKIRYRIADPACWSPTQRRKGKDIVFGPSFTEDAGRDGLHFLKADNDRLRGKQQCHQRFAIEEKTDSNTGEITGEHVRFVAFNSLNHFWRTLQELREDEKNAEDVDCWVAGTMVSTPVGPVAIEEIRVGDIVETPIGPRKVSGSYNAGKSQTIKVLLSDGNTLEGTADHKIFIKSYGLLPLCMVSSLHKPLTEGEICENGLFTAESSLKGLGVEDILNAIQQIQMYLEQPCYTGPSGLTIMARTQYQMDFTCTIKTTMDQTTVLKIWNWFLRLIMGDFMPKRALKMVAISKKLLMIGEKASAARQFFERTLKNAMTDLPKENLRALIVANLLQQNQVGRNTVQNHVRKNSITKRKRIAKFAGKNFSQSRTRQERPEHAVISAGGPYEEKTVYNITVEQSGLFYANGVLSSNTNQEDHIYDVMRYGFMSRPVSPIRKTSQAPPGSFKAERDRYIRAKKYAVGHGVSIADAYLRVR